MASLCVILRGLKKRLQKRLILELQRQIAFKRKITFGRKKSPRHVDGEENFVIKGLFFVGDGNFFKTGDSAGFNAIHTDFIKVIG